MEIPRSREELIEAHLSDDDIVAILTQLRLRVERMGDVQAAKLLLEFKYGKNPDPPNNNQTLEDLLLATPLSDQILSSE